LSKITQIGYRYLSDNNFTGSVPTFGMAKKVQTFQRTVQVVQSNGLFTLKECKILQALTWIIILQVICITTNW